MITHKIPSILTIGLFIGSVIAYPTQHIMGKDLKPSVYKYYAQEILPHDHPVVKEYLDRHNHTNTNPSNDLVCASFETKLPSGIDASPYGWVAVISSDKYRAIICCMDAPASSCKWCSYLYQFQRD